jgi:two-component system chemotaxis response regulator CheB
MVEGPIRVLVVDDSALYRVTIRNVLREVADIAVVGIARNGVEALEKIEELEPDLLTLDVQMPDMDGIGVLREINRRGLSPKAIMVSSLTAHGAQVTTDALLEGAFDFVLKPSGSDPAQNRQQLRDALAEKISAYRQTDSRIGERDRSQLGTAEVESPRDAPSRDKATDARCRVVIIAASTGGPAALKEVLPVLPAELPVPVLVVQHMPAQYTQSLARRLDEHCALNVTEATDGGAVVAGSILIAPGGRQMRVISHNDVVRVRITDDPPENNCRPAADYLLRSAVRVFGGEALAVVITGMGRDGLEGCRALKESGGKIFAQHSLGCVVYGMPKAIIEDGIADRVLTLRRIGAAILTHLEGRCPA